MNHISGPSKRGVAGVYNRALYLKERRQALEDWTRFVLKVAQQDKIRKAETASAADAMRITKPAATEIGV